MQRCHSLGDPSCSFSTVGSAEGQAGASSYAVPPLALLRARLRVHYTFACLADTNTACCRCCCCHHRRCCRSLLLLCLALPRLKGPLPEDWYLLPLEVIRLDQNLLEGELPPAWFGEGLLSSSLRVLTLWDNRLTGSLPDTQGGMQVRAGVCGQGASAHSGLSCWFQTSPALLAAHPHPYPHPPSCVGG